MAVPFARINVFTQQLFEGNPACICLLKNNFLSDALMQSIATENNVPETIFIIYHSNYKAVAIRFFSSTQEVDLCGHGLIAAAHYLWETGRFYNDEISFVTHGQKTIKVKRDLNYYSFKYIPISAQNAQPPQILRDHFPTNIVQCYQVPDRAWILMYAQQYDIIKINYTPQALRALPERSIILTAPGDTKDYVLRYFTPREKIIEDYVTGIAQLILAPLWAEILKKKTLTVQQLSSRQGTMTVCIERNSVQIIGQAVTYYTGLLQID